jgi:hypothetical protein
MLPLEKLQSLLRIGKAKGINLVGSCVDSKLLFLIVKPSFSYIVDGVFIHYNPLYEADEYDLYLIVGSKEDVEEWTRKSWDAEALLRISRDYELDVLDLLREWGSERVESEVDKLVPQIMKYPRSKRPRHPIEWKE